MNILFVNYGDFSTNSLNHIGPFANELKRRGHFCIVAVPKIDDSLQFVEERLFQFATYQDLHSASVHFPNGKPADIVHAWTPRISVSNCVRSYLKSYPSRLIIHLEDNEEALLESIYNASMSELKNRTRKDPSFSWEPKLSHPVDYKSFLASADGYSVIIDSLKAFLPPEKPILNLKPGLELERFDETKRLQNLHKQLSIPINAKIIVYPGGISASNLRDVATLYKAVKILNENGTRVQLIKTGPNATQLKEVLGFESYEFVSDLKYVSKRDLLGLIKSADVLVQPGADDAFNHYRLPSKLPEFLASGRPVLTGLANIGKALAESDACFPLPGNSAETIADCIKTVLNDEELASAIAKKGNLYAHNNFSLITNTNELETFYHSLVKTLPTTTSHESKRTSKDSFKAKRPFHTKGLFSKLLNFSKSDSFPVQEQCASVTSDKRYLPTDSTPELPYSQWLKAEEKRIAAIKGKYQNIGDAKFDFPIISVILPVHNVKCCFLSAAIESILSQIYPNWELCIAEDHTDDHKIRSLLESYSKKDTRIKIVFRDLNGGISEASNTALKLATGEFVALLDHDDLLTPHALAKIYETISNHPTASIIYSDEDKVDEYGNRSDPHFKTGWNAALLLGQNYVNHLCVYRLDLIKKVGGFRKEYDGAQDWDLLLRSVQLCDPRNIIHIPEVLYHWRAIPESSAASPNAKPYTNSAAEKTLQSHLSQTNPVADIIKGKFGNDIIRYRIKRNKFKTIVIATNPNTIYASQQLEHLQRTLRSNRNIRLVSVPKNYNFKNDSHSRDKTCVTTKTVNSIIEAHQPNEVVILGKDTFPASLEDLHQIIDRTHLIQNGVVSSKLLKPNSRILSIGTVLNFDTLYSRLFEGLSFEDDGYFQRARLASNYSLCDPSCIAFRRSIWNELGGLDDFVELEHSIIDFCLRANHIGYSNLTDPSITFINSADRNHDCLKPDNSSRDSFERIRGKWSHILVNDPFLNRNLIHDTGRYKLKSV